jgi:Zn-dependent protease with chaperone function
VGRKIISGLNAAEYEHPLDRRALEALESYKSLEMVVRKFSEYGIEKILRVQYTGSNLKVTRRNFPEVLDALEEVCETLCMSFVPSLYIRWSYGVGAFTAGVENPIIVLDSGCIDLLTYEELLSVIGHEVGHIKSQHVLYHQMASVIPILGDVIGSATLGIGGLISTGLQIPLLNWVRMSEFTADRAGLLACQDPRTAASALMKAAGIPRKYFDRINVDDFVAQAKEFEGYDLDAFDKIAKVVSIMWRQHPWIVMRASQFFQWIDGGEYDRIMRKAVSRSDVVVRQDGDKAAANPKGGTDNAYINPWLQSQLREFNKTQGEVIFCPQCGRQFEPKEVKCPKCGGRRAFDV